MAAWGDHIEKLGPGTKSKSKANSESEFGIGMLSLWEIIETQYAAYEA